MCAALWSALLLAVAAGCGGIAARTQNAEGVRLFNHGRPQEALQQFEQAIGNDPGNADGYYNLGAVYHHLGTLRNDRSQQAQAEHYYNQCLDRDENHRQCYRGLAVWLVEQQRSEKAFRLLEHWAERNPTSPEPKIELARLSTEFGDRQAAKLRLVEAISIDSGNPRALAALGKVREQSGEYALALNNYRQSLWHDRFQPDVAARIAALQPSMSPGSPAFIAPSGRTRMVSRNTIPLR